LLSCHRVKRGIVMAFNTTVKGSVFDQLMFRKDNWRGEKKGDFKMDLQVFKHCNKHDGPIKSGLLMIR
jgi:hypothetical protein